MTFVIIGNSTAAIGAVESIRKVDTNTEIILISDEPYHTYSKPLISYLLLGTTTEENMKYRDADFYLKNNCRLLASEKAIRINSDKKAIELSNNREIDYDKLLIATGSSPFVPAMQGLEKIKNKHTFMTLDDAKGLDKNISADSKVLIIGAGLIGLKCAEGILAKVSKISVVDLAPKILSSILDETGAYYVQKHLEKLGVKFYLSDQVENFEANSAFLKSGSQIDFDVLVLAVGVRPNVNLVKDAGGNVGRGIIVNDKMETSLPDVYAAGDCTESMDISSGQIKIMALLPNAYLQGECAGYNMVNRETEFKNAIAMNAIGFLGLHVLTAGTYKGDTYIENDGVNYKKLFYEDNILKGFILVGESQKAGIYTNLIRNKTPLNTLDFNLLCKQPGLLAFTQLERQTMLGGVPS